MKDSRREVCLATAFASPSYRGAITQVRLSPFSVRQAQIFQL